MKPPAFDYLRAETVGDVLGGLAQEGGDARVLAGGQSLMAMLNMRLAKPKLLIDIMRLKELRRIERQKDTVVIGAGVRQADLLTWPDLAEALPLVALALAVGRPHADPQPRHHLRLAGPRRSQRRDATRVGRT